MTIEERVEKLEKNQKDLARLLAKVVNIIPNVTGEIWLDRELSNLENEVFGLEGRL